jgi:energy-coupling factor transporter ATP-binding protein EcfA2
MFKVDGGVHIIGLVGPKGSGKSTVAKAICHMAGKAYHGGPRGIIVSFADPLRDMVKAGLGINYENMTNPDMKELPIDDYGKSARFILQTLGTEWGRKTIHPDIWANAWKRKVLKEASTSDAVIVSDDVRFQNEADIIRGMGGKLIRVYRDGMEFTGEHASELEGAKIECDASFHNVAPVSSHEFVERIHFLLDRVYRG